MAEALEQAATQPADAAPPEPLSRGTKLAYGIGDMGAAIGTQVTGFYLLSFLLDVALVPSLLVSVIFLVSNLWDAVTDPVIGNLSDKTRTRWGRRRPWLLFGAVPFGLAFFLQWYVPGVGEIGRFVYFLVMALLFKTMFTVVNVPYTALTPELARTYDERTNLTSYRFGFSVLSGVAAVVLFPIIRDMDMFTGAQAGTMAAAGFLSVFVALSSIITFTFTRERPAELFDTDEQPGIIDGLKIAFGNRPFLYVVGIYLLSWLVVQFVQANLLLYMRYWLEAEPRFQTFILVLQLTSFGFLFVWAQISKRFNKKQAYYIGVGVFIVLAVWIFTIQPNPSNLLLYSVAFVAGTGVSMALLLPWSMLPDVIEYDEIKTGLRREGVYYGLFVFIQKIGLSIALAVSPLILGLAGYVTPDASGAFVQQPDSVLLTLRVLVSLFPMVLLLLSVPLAIAYPITRDMFADMRAELAERDDTVGV